MKIEAMNRIKAVQVKTNVYPDSMGLRDLEELTKALSRRTAVNVGTNKDGISFWWLGDRTLFCTDGTQAVGFLEFNHGNVDVEFKERSYPCKQVSAAFTHPAYRGRGLILGMHQYVATRFNLLSDGLYSPEGLKIWKALKKIGHKIEVVNDRSKTKSWKDRDTLLLIRRGQ